MLIKHNPPALFLRTCKGDGTSHGGFRWLDAGHVAAPDWREDSECGGGLHGLLWGEGDASLLNWSDGAIWRVFSATESIDLGGKHKVREAIVLHTGDRKSATDYIMAHGANGAVHGAFVSDGYHGTATAGDYGTATAGYRGTATAGYRGTATAGNYGTATAGYDGTATAGNYGTATAGNYGTATAGNYGTATAGYDGTATAGNYGTIAIRWHDGNRSRLAVGYVGEDGVEANTAYRVEAGKFIKAGE